MQKITVHWLTHANTVHRTRTNSLESTAGLETLWPSPARACSSEGGLQGQQRTAQHKDALAGDSHSVSQATRRQQGSRAQRTEGLTQRRAS